MVIYITRQSKITWFKKIFLVLPIVLQNTGYINYNQITTLNLIVMAKKNVIISEGLESSEKSVGTVVVPTANDFENREFLETEEFVHVETLSSSKYDEVREPKVQAGLESISELLGDKINPLLILLGKWWENKTARSAIKKMLDDEAASKNIPADVYLQQVLRENVDKLAEIQSAVDRLRYAITYFKPRGGIGTKPIFKPIAIDGVNYNVNLAVLSEAKEKFGDDKEQIKNYVRQNSEKIEIEEYL